MFDSKTSNELKYESINTFPTVLQLFNHEIKCK